MVFIFSSPFEAYGDDLATNTVSLTNAGFEAGDWTGWSVSGGGGGVNDTYGPPEGSFKAELQTDNTVIWQDSAQIIEAGDQ